MSEILIAEIYKNDKNIIRLMVREYRENEFFDFRQWFLTDEGNWTGTRKGFTFTKEMLPEILEAMAKLEDYL